MFNKMVLFLLLSLLTATNTYAGDTNETNFHDFTRDAERLFGQPKQIANISNDVARDSAERAYYTNLTNYYIDATEHRKSEWNHRLMSFKWQYYSSIIIFVVVILIMLTGLYFSFLQFKASNYGQTDGEQQKSQFKMSKDGIEINSSVIGLLILSLSLAFFYLYLKEVYPLNPVQQPHANVSTPKS